MIRFSILLLIVFVASIHTHSQPIILNLIPQENSVVFKKISYEKNHNSQESIIKELNKIILSLNDIGYLAASIDSIKHDSLFHNAFITIGNSYKWAHLKKGNIEESILSEVGFREKIYRNKPLHYKKVALLQERILTLLENNGYPFASIKLDSISLFNNAFGASLHIEKNNLIKIDSIINTGNAKMNTAYLHRYIGIKPGDLYNEGLIRKLPNRIKELSFISSKEAPIVLFSEKTTKLSLHLNKKRASQFDGIIGVLPNNETGKILFTGDVRLKLQNAINHGELIDINWRRLQAETQDLKTQLAYPFIFSLPFGIDYGLKLYKRDTTFIDVNQTIGIQYILAGSNYLKAFVNRKNSSLLSTAGLENISVLPPNADIKATGYGLGLKIERLDYRINPRKGIFITLNTMASNRKIIKNSGLNEMIYANLKLTSVQYSAELIFANYIPIKNRSTLKLGLQSAIINSSSIFQNELYRIGGLKTLRGFDEESIFVSSYSILTLEYRYIFEQNSYLYVFSDAAYYENKSISFSGQRYAKPIGWGAGITFETKAGIFSINYALGKQFNNPINLRSGKVHFGIVNYF